MLAARILVILCAVSAEFLDYGSKYDMTSQNDVSSRDVTEEQELDRLLTEIVDSKKKKSDAKQLSCYTCASTESWEMCEKNQVLIDCPADMTHCITATITIDGEIVPITEYYKGCVQSKRCYKEHYPACKAGSKESAHCSIECCDDGLCNKETRPVKRSFSFDCKPPCLMYGSLHEINGIELMTSRKVPGMTSLSHVTPVEVDMPTRAIYWSDKTKHEIMRTNLVNGVSEVVIGGENGRYEGIAIEWISRLIYWTDRNNKRIEVAKTDGSSRRMLINDGLAKPRAIAVDPKYGYMFWTDWSDLRPCIERASLSGQHRQVLISTNIHWPNGLVLDYSSRKVYFSESYFHRIESMNYDGSERRILYTDRAIQPFDLAMYGSSLFWSDWGTRSVEKINVQTGKRLGNYGILTSDRIAGVAVADVSRQPQVDSLCAVNNGDCSHLCFTTGLQSRDCGCPNGVKLLADKKTCDLGLSTTLATTHPTTKESTTPSTKQTTTPSTTLPTTTPPTTTRQPTTTAPTTEPTTIKAGTTPSSGVAIRLVDGALPSEGRVEIRYNGQWGTICDNLWDLREAMVVCKMLGYPGAVADFHGGFFGEGRGPIWLDDVNCIGDESSIDKCRHPGWGVHDCIHAEDAGVKCRSLHTTTPVLPVRLANGRAPHEGRVEVRHNGLWGTVCDDLWSKTDAAVICRMLGYPGAVMATREASFGQGTGPIWLDNVRCLGHEQSIEECSHQGWGNSNCRHFEDAGVICQPKVIDQPTTAPPPAPISGFAIICLPRAMYIRISKRHLQDMISHDVHPDSLHLNDPSCGVVRESRRHVLLGTPLNSCGTKRRHMADSLTFTNKVIVDLSGFRKRVIRSSPFEFPFRCSYMRRNTRREMAAPPQHERHGQGRIGQW